MTAPPCQASAGQRRARAVLKPLLPKMAGGRSAARSTWAAEWHRSLRRSSRAGKSARNARTPPGWPGVEGARSVAGHVSPDPESAASRQRSPPAAGPTTRNGDPAMAEAPGFEGRPGATCVDRVVTGNLTRAIPYPTFSSTGTARRPLHVRVTRLRRAPSRHGHGCRQPQAGRSRLPHESPATPDLALGPFRGTTRGPATGPPSPAMAAVRAGPSHRSRHTFDTRLKQAPCARLRFHRRSYLRRSGSAPPPGPRRHRTQLTTPRRHRRCR